MNNAERLLETLEMSFGESRSDDWRSIARARAGEFPNPRDEVDEVDEVVSIKGAHRAIAGRFPFNRRNWHLPMRFAP